MGKPFQVESSGELLDVEFDPPFNKLTPFQTEIFALNLHQSGPPADGNSYSPRDPAILSYELPGKARFRVNIFSQRGNYSIVLRKLETKIPTCKELNLPDAF